MSNWRVNAACVTVDPDLFFDAKPGYRAKARRICGRCPVAADCLTAIMAVEGIDTETGKPYDSWQIDLNHRFGIFAGLSAFERWCMDYPHVDRKEAALVRDRRKRVTA